MHRPAWLRLLTAVWGFWFATSVVEPAGLFACEMHGAPVHHTAAAAHALQTAQNASPGNHADHQISPAAPAGHHSFVTDAGDAESPQHHACCTCLGHCCQSAPVAVSSSAVTLGHVAEREVGVVAITLVSRAVTRRPYDLPFANGPPVFAL